MKKLLYISLIILSAVVVFAVLLLYYTQDFSEKFDFSDSVNLDDVNYDYSGSYISSVSGNIGTLTLENNGYFTEYYNFPSILGCINLKEGSEINLPREDFRVLLESDPGFSIGSPVKIGVGVKKTFNLLAKYTPRSSKVSLVQLQDNVQSLSLYNLKTKEPNPFGTGYYSSGKTCEDLGTTAQPIKVVNFFG